MKRVNMSLGDSKAVKIRDNSVIGGRQSQNVDYRDKASLLIMTILIVVDCGL